MKYLCSTLCNRLCSRFCWNLFRTKQSINRLERQLSKEESRHKNFVIDFADKLEKSKKNLSEKEIKNSEQFYLIMRRGEGNHL